MPLVSVIMPSYNVKNYVSECLESVCNQTFKDIEILSIDAGSEDGTLEILREYEKKDSRIKVYLSEKKSYGYQVNKGIDLAQGEYIAIVETDDIVENNMIELLYTEAKEYNLDYVKGQFARIIAFSDGVVWKQKLRMYPLTEGLSEKVIVPSQNAMAYIKDIYLWCGLYKKEFLALNNIRLNETKGAAYQDVGFAFQVIGCAQRAMYVPDIVYNYRQNNVDSSIFNSNGFQYLATEYPFVWKRCTEKGISDNTFISAYYTRMFLQIMTRYITMAASGGLWENTAEDRRVLREYIKKADDNDIFNEVLIGKNYWLELKQYLYDEETYWQYQVSRYNGKRKCLQDLLDKAKSAETIIFYSKSIVGGFVYCILKTAGINVPVYFCDNDEKKQGTRYMSVPVIGVEEAVWKNPNALYIIANRRFDQSMRQQLLRLGVAKAQMYVWMLDIDILLLHMKCE